MLGFEVISVGKREGINAIQGLGAKHTRSFTQLYRLLMRFSGKFRADEFFECFREFNTKKLG